MRLSAPLPLYSPPPQLAKFAKWAGLACGPLAWIVDQQLISQSSCPDFDSVFVLFVGIMCGGAAIAGILVSAHARTRLRQHPQRGTSSTDSFIASACAVVATIALLAIVFGTSTSIALQCQG